ncbi:MAG TPA: DUF4410 domain-containing protein [Myxococcota bacterium]|nr:DUF4410 domain-containing protein [Myxococcota bacterium]HRY97170.1 DUF4410 domain-containing protein [Myxococcota bacterium]HSA20711.1 DUF4410 domain-containing protein [Myxococcota bacterium]
MLGKNRVVVLVALALVLGGLGAAGCGGAGVSIIRTDLAPGALSRADALVFKAVDPSATEFAGDFSDDPPSVAANRETLRTTYAAKAASSVQAAGFKAEVLAEGAAPADGAVVVEMVVKKFEAGSNASRVVWGFGAGASYLLTDVKLLKGGNTVADFTIDATSGGRGGFSGIGNFLVEHIDDSVAQLAAFLSEKVPQ